MSRAAAEPMRKAALINAVIAAVGRAGSLDVTVAQIAREAGMSPALAHHYFGSKDRMFLAAMRTILTRYRESVRAELAATPDDRLGAILRASLGGDNLDRATVAAWLNFYSLTLREPEAARLLAVYHRRLRSNLILALRPAAGPRAARVADTLGALIDGVYLRVVLDPGLNAAAAVAMVTDYLDEVRHDG